MEDMEMDVLEAARYLKDNSIIRINEEKDLEFSRKAQADAKKYEKALKKLRENPREVKDKIRQDLKSEGYIIHTSGNDKDILISDKPYITNFSKETKSRLSEKELQELPKTEQDKLSEEDKARLEEANKATAETDKNKEPEKSGIEFVLNLYGLSLKSSKR